MIRTSLPKTLSNSSKLIFLVHNSGHHSDMDKHEFMVDEDVRSIQQWESVQCSVQYQKKLCYVCTSWVQAEDICSFEKLLCRFTYCLEAGMNGFPKPDHPYLYELNMPWVQHQQKWRSCWTDRVKRELSLIYLSIYISTLNSGHDLWLMTKRVAGLRNQKGAPSCWKEVSWCGLGVW